MSIERPEGDLIQALIRGLGVITAISGATSGLTLSEVSRRANTTRATSRRILLTLESVGYVSRHDGRFFLTARVLELGYAYLSSLGVWQVCRPHLVELSDKLDTSVSVGVLDRHRVVYVSRVPGRKITSISPKVGTRIPAHASSMGRVLLAARDPAEVHELLSARPLSAYTPQTVTDIQSIEDILIDVKRNGWALVEDELEVGLRAVAVPLRRGTGEVVAAMNVGFHRALISNERIQAEILPAMYKAAELISQDLGRLDPPQDTIETVS